MKDLSLFAGIGAFEKALKNIGIQYELVGFSEIDKYAVSSYCAIHGVDESKNLGDITKIDESTLPKDIDLITYGFPCQDISLSGKQKGLFNEDGSQTRSGLFFEALRIIEATQPRVAIAENVKNLTSKKFSEQFKIVLDSLEAAGYNNYWQVLNAKDYGIPQNRERVFIVSIRKDIDTGSFSFPKGFPLELRLKDMLEDEVDEKYYIKEKRMEIIKKNLGNVFENNFIIASSQKNAFVGNENICPSLTNAMGSGGGQTPMIRDECKEISDLLDEMQQTDDILEFGTLKWQLYEKYGVNKICPRCGTQLLKSDLPQYKYLCFECDENYFDIEAKEKGQIQMVGMLDIKGNEQVRRVYGTDEISPTLNTMQGGNRQPKVLIEPTIQRIDIPQTVKIRKYPVDCKLLCECLRSHKFALNISNKDIAESLDVPLTKVEHWFRQDDCFAIPDPDIWTALKEVLNIETDEFDEAIMTFEEKEGVYEKSERHYFVDGIAPTLTSTTAAEKVIEPSLRIRKLTPKECFRLMGFSDEDFEKTEAVNSDTQLYKQAGNSIVVPVVEYIIKALFECGALEKEREDEEMELKVQKPTFPEVIQFNFEELKQEITKKSADYMNLVYGEDQIQEAKKDRATLNKFVKALSDERIKIKKECLKPYEDFEVKIKELDGIVNAAIKNIDDQVKGYEEKKKNEKLDKIKEYWQEKKKPFAIEFERIMDVKWLNASVSMKSVQTQIDELLAKIDSDLATLENLPEFSFEAKDVYKTTLNLQQAISEGQRLAEIQKRKKAQEEEQARLKAEAEAKKHMLPPAEEFIPPVVDKELEEKAFGEPQRMWIGFKAHLTVEQAGQLKNFFDCRGIEFERIAI